MSVVEYREYSVLMSVYHKEKPEYLKQAIESIQTQTLSTNDFVLVCDGPLNEQLDDVIATKQQEMGDTLNVVRLAKNGGLGNALNEGIKYCKNELVARMDSDDIAYPDRCEKQIAVFNTHSEVSICSGIVEEFTTDPNTVDTRRVPPETNAEIIEFAKKRNPFNHPCVMYKKSAVEAVGSYQDFYLLEDYYLWLRMLMAGYQGYNIQEPLLHMRAGSDMYLRRAGWKYAKTAVGDKYVYEYMAKNGCRIGGEQSGHIIFSKYASTGDGILTSLKMMEVMLAKKLPMSKLAEPLKIYPQVLENVRVTDKKAAQNDPAVQEAVNTVAEALGDTGRILVRESGTEPVVRVMVEAPDHDTCQKYVSQVVETIKSRGYGV